MSRGWLPIVVFASIVQACTDPTQVLVRITADPSVAERATTLHIEVSSEGEVTYDERARFGPDLARLDDEPAQLTLVPTGGDPERRYRVTMTLADGDGPFSTRRILGGFEAGAVREVRVHFEQACSDADACSQEQTCDATSGTAQCVDACVELAPPGQAEPSALVSCGEPAGCGSAEDGSPCEADGAPGRCWNGSCCTGCWDRASEECVGGDADAACGRNGAECTECSLCEGSTCTPSGGCVSSANAIHMGREHACVTLRGDTLCWGANGAGQVGTGTTDPVRFPTSVTGVRQLVALGGSHTCSTDPSGQLSCWGSASDGQLGFWSDDQLTPPAPEPSAEARFEQLGAGRLHTCGLRGGEVYCWGQNSNAQVGQSDLGMIYAPTAVAGTSGAEVLSVTRDTNCIVRDGELWCWGLNADGEWQVGVPNEAGVKSYDEPQADPSDLSWEDVDVGRVGVCGLANGGQLHCRGSLAIDELFLTPPEPHLPALVAPGPFEQVSTGALHVCVIDADRRLLCAGTNLRGELGAGEEADRRSGELLPVAGVGWRWAALAVGGRTTCALRDDRTLWCWGDDEHLQLGSEGGHAPRPRRVCFAP